MDKMKLFEAVNMIDEDLIKDASGENIRASADTEINGEEKNITVSGVETYRKLTLQRFAAAASAVLLIAGLGAGGFFMLKDRPPLLNEVGETTSPETTAVTEKKTGGKGTDNSGSSIIPATAAENRTEKDEDMTMSEENNITDKPYGEDGEQVTEAPREENGGAVTTAETTIQWKTSPANAQTRPKPTTVTTAEVHYPGEKPTATEPINPYAPEFHEPGYYRTNYLTWYPEDTEWLFNILENLDYQPYTCDGLPEGIINGRDGNTYRLNFTERWVWRNGGEEAPMPDELRQYFIGIAE